MALVDRSVVDERNKLIREAAAAEELLKRTRARTNMTSYSTYVEPIELPAKHHRLICDALDDVIEGRNRRLMLFMPPGVAKSTYTSVRFAPYFLGKDPQKSIICASYGEGLATSFGRKVRNALLSKEYQNVFPGVTLSEDSRAKGEWETNKGGSYFAAGVGSAITGRRADLGLIDDPVKSRKEADSELARNETWQWYLSDFFSRLKPNAAQIIIQCMTGDTQVTMSDGEQKELKNIKVGDEVATYDNGEITSSRVLNWKRQGLDSVYEIKTSCGIIVRANERHPFLVEREGKKKWIRLKNLHAGDNVVRVTGEDGKKLNAPLTDARKKCRAKGFAHRTTIKKDGLMVSVLHLLEKILRPALAQNLSTATASPLTTTWNYSGNKMEFARSAGSYPKKLETLSTGTQYSASTTAMKKGMLGGFYATIATLLLVATKRQKYLSQQQNISGLTLGEITSIKPCGVEEVFDIQVERTENFIANGLVSHNTRWHEDDLSGRILPESWNGESGDFEGFDGQIWRVICLPAQARENDVLGREVGEWLWPDYFTPDVWEEIKSVQTSKDVRNWNSLYQQIPQPDSGVFFQREWFKRFRIGDEPRALSKYGASDYAVSDNGGDFTEHGVGGFDEHDDLYFVDWWSGQKTMDVWIKEQMILVKRHDPFAWIAEVGTIRRSAEPWVKKEKQKHWFRTEWMSHIGDKAANARAFQGLAAQGKVYIPNCEWGEELINQLVKFIPNTNFKDDKVDVCGLFGRILDQAYAPSILQIETKKETDSYDENEEEPTWKLN